MFALSLSSQDQRDLARNLTTFLSQYKYISDSYIIEFFTEDLWERLPAQWREVLCGLSFPQIADLLLDTKCQEKRYPSAWPLSLLAFRATAHALSFPRRAGQGGAVDPVEEFLKNHSQSSMLSHIFRKHVKPKKQHEIRKLGSLVKQLCDQTNCEAVVDVGSGQGHLTRFLSFGLGLSVTAIEADQRLVTMATKFDEELRCTLEKEKTRDGPSDLSKSGPSPHHVVGWVNPKASWELFLRQLREAECTAAAPSPLDCSSRKRRRNSAELDQTQAPLATGPEPSALSIPFSVSATTPPPHWSTNSFGCSPHGRHSGELAGQSDKSLVLTGLHACGDLSATLLRHFVECPHVRGITSVACCYMKITTREYPSPPGLVVAPPAPALAPAPQDPLHRPRLFADDSDGCCPGAFGYPMSSWVRGLPGHGLSYKAREGACHAMEDYLERLREGSLLLRTHCYRATLETVIREARPEMRRVGVQTIKKAHLLPFTEYARLGLARLGLPPSLLLEPGRLEAMLKQEARVVVYFSLALLLAPAVETLVLLDRIIYLQENGVKSKLLPLFDPELSPRNFVLVAMKTDC
ncbi:methyltransferase-like protein 25B [Gadus morhua]|uniref:Methyltransferase like 25B n=1 Tax=Gadus morhua TaxID=8049 RepID=A0A8C5CN19_GADMO|nr:protein RRNAD1 [Gadus morhua]